MIPQALRDQWTRSTVGYYWDGEKYAKAQAGEPREAIDPETGDRYILAEPQRTNECGRSSAWSNDYVVQTDAVESDTKTSVIPNKTAYEFTAQNNSPGARATQDSAGTYTNNIEVAYAILERGTANHVRFRLGDGNQGGNVAGVDYLWAEDESFSDSIGAELSTHHQRFSFDGQDLVKIVVRYDPTDQDGTDRSGNSRNLVVFLDIDENNDSVVIHHTQVEEAPFSTSPIVTGSSTVTRSNDEVSSLTAPLASGAKSVYFRVGQEAAGYGPGEGGNITNAAINLTTSGNEGSAGNGLLRPSAGVMGVSADGIIDEVINTSDSDIQGNSTTSDVDTFVIKPHKDTTGEGAIYRIYNLDVWEGERTQSEKESLRNGRPQPWLELDGETISDLNSDQLWDDNGIDPPPYQWDIAKHGTIPAKIRSAWNRSSSARRFDGSKFVSEGADVARLDYGPDGNPNGLQVEADGKTNQVSQSCDASVKNGAGELSNIADRTSIVKGETAHLIEATDDAEGPEWNFQQHSGGLEHAHFILEKSSSPASASLIRVETDGNTSDILKYDWGSYDLSNGVIPSGQLESRILSADGPNGGTLVEIFAWWDGNESFNVDGAQLDLEIWPDADGAGNGCIHHYTGFSEGPPGGSPIITDASSVTRAWDDYSIPMGDWWNTSEGTLLFDVVMTQFITLDNDSFIENSSNGTRYLDFGQSHDPRVYDSGESGTPDYPLDNIRPFQRELFGISFDESSVILSSNGKSSTASVSDAFVKKGNIRLTGGSSSYELVKLFYVPRTLTESTLNTITTPDAPEITLTDSNGINLSAYVRA
ncbi:phage head spike fiber domain-containing protein [Salinibacter ruber]|uniref:Uncharacterized protein n=1 Tax=Salinibacter ruber TaxID=146919 RepID=A0AAW5P6P1_9BACT|nr:hypothetical protein [Salinibacter ruber]MCS4157667.1 hypothetical protein [Salinibacter ruber]